jgi:hypothetical protein
MMNNVLKSMALLCLFIQPAFAQSPAAPLDSIAESYVKLVLKVGLHNDDYVDFYYGPEEWKIAKAPESKEKYPLADLANEASSLIRRMESLPWAKNPSAREKFLLKQLLAVKAFINILQGTKYTFDEESQALYDVVPPHVAYSYYDSLLARLDGLLPGEGAIGERLEEYRDRFIVPHDKMIPVLETVTEKSRQLTHQYLDLPENEQVTSEYVTDKPWGGFCTFLGNAHSLVQLNTDLPYGIIGLMDQATHEVYPGHHTNFTLFEKCLVNDSGWVEFTVSPLYTPFAIIAEGIATNAIDIAFPDDDRLRYMREVLFPIAGFDPEEAEHYLEVNKARNQLSNVDIAIARDYLDGANDSLTTATLMKKYFGCSDEEADRLISFLDAYRCYWITYPIGYDLVNNYVLTATAGSDDPDLRWKTFKTLLTTPVTPSDLRVE